MGGLAPELPCVELFVTAVPVKSARALLLESVIGDELASVVTDSPLSIVRDYVNTNVPVPLPEE